ncbi:hypothetical protein [Pelagibacterium lacus]|uniref:Uncharacterized protein n=1 Tax=Pelagibacterium lacus TaxID=2282655 RepID=A0A369WA55_9HYPH|nr:hypothetical protein [Pelagibacterium lacus]RDE10162.1 hypothetical protein DVH29_01835 [Pelagibacterium lacus]
MQDNESEPLVEMLFRNGTLTVVAVVLSFSLSFVTQWAHNPIPWAFSDRPTLLLLSVGIVCQGISLALLLRHDSVKRRIYDRASWWFIAGIASTGAGVISAIVVDFIQLVS